MKTMCPPGYHTLCLYIFVIYVLPNFTYNFLLVCKCLLSVKKTDQYHG